MKKNREKPTPDPATKEAVGIVGDRIAKALADEFFAIEGTPKAVVLIPGKGYRHRPLIAGWEYRFSYAYIGESGKTIFGFEPEDAQEYTHIEFNAKQVDEFLPMIGGAITRAFDFNSKDATESFPDAFELLTARYFEEKAAVEEAAQSVYDDNPEFGMF